MKHGFMPFPLIVRQIQNRCESMFHYELGISLLLIAFAAAMILRSRKRSRVNTRTGNANRGMTNFLVPSAPTTAKKLKAAGYATAHFGKWHMGGGHDVDDAPLPQAYGFDESLVSFDGFRVRLRRVAEFCAIEVVRHESHTSPTLWIRENSCLSWLLSLLLEQLQRRTLGDRAPWVAAAVTC